MADTTAVAKALTQYSSNINLTLGAVEIGVLMSTMLYGTFFIQAYLYATTPQSDRATIKLLVSFVWLVETTHILLIWMYLYNASVSHFGNIAVLLVLPWQLYTSITLQGLVGASVQAFFTYRLFKVSQSWILTVPLWICEAFRVAFDIGITVRMAQTASLPTFRERYNYMVSVMVCTSAAIDIINTSLLCYFLRSRTTTYRSTMQMINWLVLWSIETGMLTTLAALLLVLFWTTMSNNALWLLVLMLYAKLYSNSLLVSLNARETLRHGRATNGVYNFEMSDGRNPGARTLASAVHTHPNAVVVTTETVAHTDEDLNEWKNFALDDGRVKRDDAIAE